MARFKITVQGCDDATVVVADLTPAELVVVERLAQLITGGSEYDCQPTLSIQPVTGESGL